MLEQAVPWKDSKFPFKGLFYSMLAIAAEATQGQGATQLKSAAKALQCVPLL